MTCGCNKNAPVGTYSCKGQAPSETQSFFMDDECTEVTSLLLEAHSTVIHAEIDAEGDSNAQELAILQIAEVAKRSGPKMVLIVKDTVQKEIPMRRSWRSCRLQKLQSGLGLRWN